MSWQNIVRLFFNGSRQAIAGFFGGGHGRRPVTVWPKERAARILSGLDEIVIVARSDGELRTANAKAKAFLRRQGHASGRRYLLSNILTRYGRNVSVAALDQFFGTGDEAALDIVYDWPDGTWQAIAWRCSQADEAGNMTLIGRDVTRRMAAERALAQSQRRLKLLTEATQDGLWEWDLTTDTVWFSPQWKAQLGYADDAFSNSFAAWRDAIYPEDAESALALLSDFVAGRAKKFEMVQRFVHKQEYTVYILSRATCDMDADGHVSRLVGSHTDLTEIKKREAILQRNIALRRAVTDGALDAVITTDQNGRIIEYNPAAETIFGYKARDAIGADMGELILTPAVRVAHRTDMQRYLDHGEAATLNQRREVDALTEAGQRIPIELAVVPVEIGQEIYFTAYLRDISGRKAAQQALEDSEARFRSLAANVPGVIYQWYETVGGERGFSYVSPRAWDLFGVDAATLESDWRALPLHRDDEAAWQQSLDEAITRGGDWSFEGRFVLPSGEVKWWRGVSRPVFRDNGDVVFNGLILDVSEQKRLEDELRKARDQAQAANQAKSEFLAMMSHEIRTPMNGVLGTLQLLFNADLGEEAAALAAQGRQSAEILLNLLNDILDYSKIEAGKLRLEAESFCITNLMNAVDDLIRPQAEAKGLVLTRTITGDVPKYLYGDSGRLRQMLLNLASNAVKYTASGQVAMRVERLEAPPGERRADDDGIQYVGLRFVVADTGIGIAPHMRSRVFEKFDQLGRSGLADIKGTGLGLAITKHLSELMGGTVDFESEEGQGSRFWFDVPLRVSRASKDAAGTEDTVNGSQADSSPGLIGRDGGSPRILVAEDNVTNQLVIRLMLEKLGCTVTLVDDGAAAVSAVNDNRFDLILMDAQMPNMDGMAATRAIRAREKRDEQWPIVALTANALPEQLAAYRQAGMNTCVTKPVTMAHLQAVLSQFLPSGEAPVHEVPNGAGTIENPENEAAAASDRHAGNAAAAPLCDPAVMARFGADFGAETVPRLIETFLADLKRTEQALAEALEAGDMARIQREVHQLKSTAGSYGAERLRRFATQANDAAVQGQPKAAMTHARATLVALPATLQAFEVLPRQLAAGSRDEADA